MYTVWKGEGTIAKDIDKFVDTAWESGKEPEGSAMAAMQNLPGKKE